MASAKEEAAAAAAAVTAQQLSSVSLGESAESRKKNETEPTTKNGTPTKKMCSACGEKSDTLMKCRACKCVWYCDKDCQNKHWKEHKIECRPIKKELRDEEASSMSARSWMSGLLRKCPLGRSVQYACAFCRSMQSYKRTLVAVARPSAPVAIISR